jgi:hypothetical protein
VDAGPRVRVGGVCAGAPQHDEQPGGVGDVDGDDDEADDEEADEAGFGGVAGGDEADEFAAVAVEAVGEDAWWESC